MAKRVTATQEQADSLAAGNDIEIEVGVKSKRTILLSTKSINEVKKAKLKAEYDVKIAALG